MTVPTFTFDREPPFQQRARRALAPAALLAGAAYLPLDAFLSSLLGGVWGVLATLLLVSTPLGALWWAGERGARGWRAWRAGVLLGALVVAMYAWLFIGSVA